MKLLLANHNGISVYFFNKLDTEMILTRCRAAGKQWTDMLQGFLINLSAGYVAISIKGDDGVIESMEYVDIETNKPEFTISENFTRYLSAKEQNSEISLHEFEPILNNILSAPVRARRFEVYPEVSKQYAATH